MHVMKWCKTDEDPRLAHAYEQLKICLEALHTLKLEHTWKFTLVNKNGILQRWETKNENVPKWYSKYVSRPSRTTTPHLMAVAISQLSISQFKWWHTSMFLLVSFVVWHGDSSPFVMQCYTCCDVAIRVCLCYVVCHTMLHRIVICVNIMPPFF